MRFSSFKKAILLILTFNLSFFYTSCESVTVLPPTNMDGTALVAADNNSNAVAVYQDSAGLISARYSPGNLTWEPAVIISDAIQTKVNLDVAMDASSTALAIWRGINLGNFTIETNRLSGGVWGVPQVLEGPTANPLVSPSIAMNGSGDGVAAWVNVTLNEVHASFFISGVWQPFQVIGTSQGGPLSISFSANGNAVVLWNETATNSTFAVTSTGLTWQTPTLLDSVSVSSISVGTDANGNSIAMWSIPGSDLKWSRFDNGLSTWSVPQILDTLLQPGVSVVVAPNGNAVAIWIISNGGVFDVYYSQFNGTTWSLPTFLAQGWRPAITMDSNGDTLLGWVDFPIAKTFYAARLPLGGVLEPSFIVSTGADTFSTNLALSSGSSLGIAAFQTFNGTFQNFATFILFDPSPSTGIFGRVCKNNFAMQSDRVHIIKWDPSSDPTTVAYNIYRNGVLLSQVPSTGPFTFYDHNRKKGCPNTYTVFAVNALGVQSSPVTITLD